MTLNKSVKIAASPPNTPTARTTDNKRPIPNKYHIKVDRQGFLSIVLLFNHLHRSKGPPYIQTSNHKAWFAVLNRNFVKAPSKTVATSSKNMPPTPYERPRSR